MNAGKAVALMMTVDGSTVRPPRLTSRERPSRAAVEEVVPATAEPGRRRLNRRRWGSTAARREAWLALVPAAPGARDR